MKFHRLYGKDYAKAVGVGIVTALVLSAIAVTGLKTGVSPLPQPLALAFANTLFGTELPLFVGLLFHLVWVTFWSVMYVQLFWERLTFGPALGLGLALWALVLVVFYPLVGWGFLGVQASPLAPAAALVMHLLFAVVLWALAHWVLGTHHPPAGRRYSRA